MKSRILVGSEILSEGSEMLGNGFWRVRDGLFEVSRRSHQKLNFGRIRNFELGVRDGWWRHLERQ